MLLSRGPQARACQDQIERIVAAQFGPKVLERAMPMIAEVIDRRDLGELGIEQLLDAVFISESTVPSDIKKQQIMAALLGHLGESR
jgi:hypothetical protein